MLQAGLESLRLAAIPFNSLLFCDLAQLIYHSVHDKRVPVLTRVTFSSNSQTEAVNQRKSKKEIMS